MPCGALRHCATRWPTPPADSATPSDTVTPMDTLHIYDKLLQFALFQGLSKADLGALVTHTRLGFHKYAEGDTIARAQTTCDRLFFLIDGRIEVVTSADNGSYAVAETAAAPLLFEPEALFGVTPHYASPLPRPDALQRHRHWQRRNL